MFAVFDSDSVDLAVISLHCTEVVVIIYTIYYVCCQPVSHVACSAPNEDGHHTAAHHTAAAVWSLRSLHDL